MTLLFFDGFQDFPTHKKSEWTPVQAGSTSGGPGTSAATGRDGTTNGAVGMHGGTSGTYSLTAAIAASDMVCVGTGLMVGTVDTPDANHYVFGFFIGATGPQLSLTINALGWLELRRGSATGTLLATSSGHDRITPNVWHHYQMKCDLKTAGGTAVVKLDGVEVINFSGQTSASTTQIDGVRISTRVNVTGLFTLDDFWVCNGVDATATQGRPNNDFLGDLKVANLLPSANGDSTSWSKSTGTNAATLTDESPPNTTDYIFSATSGQQELMALPDLPAASTDVYGVRVSFYGLKTDAGASSVKPLVKENSTVTAQAAKPLSVTVAAYHGDALFTKPSAPTTPWTESDINALQVGVELA